MNRRSLLTTALVAAALVSGGDATMAVAGQPATARQDDPAAGPPQYITCDEVAKNNRVHERWLAQAHRRGERLVPNRGARRRLRRMNRRHERALRRRHRAVERRCRSAPPPG